MKRNQFLLVCAVLIAALTLTACGQSSLGGVTPTGATTAPVQMQEPQPTTQPATQPQPLSNAIGTVLLSVNPEIEIDYNSEGLVVEVSGRNEGGKLIAADPASYIGKPCAQVTSELVEKIYSSGVVTLDADGNPKNIVVKLEEGSRYPNDDFLTAIAQSVKTTVDNRGSKSQTMVIDQKDLTANGMIGLEKAKELVIAQLGVPEAQFINKDYDLDDGKYELEFTVDGIEYEYDVDAYTGKILKVETETAGWDDPNDPFDNWDDWDDQFDDDWDDRYDDWDDRFDDDWDDRYDDDDWDDRYDD